jgi:hypothetical protein
MAMDSCLPPRGSVRPLPLPTDNRMHKRIFVTHHKTGHHLCHHIGQAVSQELGLTYYDLSTAAEVPNDADVVVYESGGQAVQPSEFRFESYGGDLQIQNLKFKGVHVVRHPFEIISSAYRWHKTIHRPWLDEEWRGTGKSYKEHLLSEDGIAFEMKHLSRKVIMYMYFFPYSDHRFLQVKLEDFEANYDSTIASIARHLGIPQEVMLKTSAPFNLNTMTHYPSYVTRTKLEKRSHVALFAPHHYDLFHELFPPDLLCRLGYHE